MWGNTYLENSAGTLIEVDPGRLKRKLSVTAVSRPVEAARKTVVKSTKGIFSNAIQLGNFRLN
jgi:hypothetical protein